MFIRYIRKFISRRVLISIGFFVSIALLTNIEGLSFSISTVHAAPTWTNCTPENIVTYSGRVHIKCVESIGGIRYFAASTADEAKAARILSVITAAQTLGRTALILYDPADTSGTSFGCASTDCRTIIAVGFGQ